LCYNTHIFEQITTKSNKEQQAHTDKNLCSSANYLPPHTHTHTQRQIDKQTNRDQIHYTK